MRYSQRIAVWFIVGLVLGLILGMALPADGSVQQEPNRATVVWEMGGWDGRPVWDPPQEFVAVQFTVDGDINSADHLIPECGYFQVDVYKYNNDSNRAKVDNLIAGGLLYGPNNPPEPLIRGGEGTAWKFVNQGECGTASTTTTTTVPPTTTSTSTTTTSTSIPESTTTTTVPDTTTTTEPPSSTTTTQPSTTTSTTEPPTTSTVPPTTTTTPPSTTTSTPTSTTTSEPSPPTTQSVCDESHPAWNEDTQSCELPYTGLDMGLVALVAGTLLAAGGLSLLAGRAHRQDG